MGTPFATRRQRKLVSEINVVPYIDVMLVLLIIFMVTAPLVMQGIRVDLPKVDAQAVPTEDNPPVLVTVDAEGRLYVESFYADEQAPPSVTTAELVQQVLALTEARPGTDVLIKGDRNVPYGSVVTVMSALKAAGIAKVGLVTLPLDGEVVDLAPLP